MNIDKITESISRIAIGFPSEEALRKYLKEHPKADRKNHWVELSDGKPSGSSELFQVPKQIGKEDDYIDLTKSVLRSSTPNQDGTYDWYDFKGKKVTDSAVIFRAERLMTELSLSPNLTGVRVFTDHRIGSKKPFAIAYNSGWEKRASANPFKYYYTDAQIKTSNDRIMQKNIVFSQVYDERKPQIMKDAENGIVEAVIIRFIDRHHIRIGTQGQKNDGLCTMKAKYCHVKGNSVEIIDMPTKSDQKYSGTITDPILVRELKKRLAKSSPDDIVFRDTNDERVNQYLKKALGDEEYSTKNIRTCEATGLAFKHVFESIKIKNGQPVLPSLEERYKIMAEACEVASKALNNTPDVCHSNYIDKRVWEILMLPDSEYHKEYPIEKINEDGSFVFKSSAKLEKAEGRFRNKLDDDKSFLWDQYQEAKTRFLEQLNKDRALDGEPALNALPPIHMAKLLKRFVDKAEV